MTARERATVLAALRHWQDCVLRKDRTGEVIRMPYFVDHAALGLAEVNDLCSRLALRQAHNEETNE